MTLQDDDFVIVPQPMTEMIRQHVEMGCTQQQIAELYSLALREYAAGVDEPDWPAINAAILAKWSPSGLERIKAKAWKLARAQTQKPAD